MKRLLFLSFLALIFNASKSQIVMSEVGYANQSGIIGNHSIGTLPGTLTYADQWPDYIELYNATPGFTLSLKDFYLTNSQTDLYKWKIPSNLSIAPFQHMTFFCTGLNVQETNFPYRWHTNFTIEQCKNQWVMLTYNGVIKDSIFVRRTKPNDSWGHYPDGNANLIPNTKRWYLLQNGCSQGTDANNTLLSFPNQVYYGYAPIPTFTSPAAPGFSVPISGTYDMYIQDTMNFQINYTQGYCGQLGGTIPCSSYSGCVGNTSSAQTYTYQDGLTTPISPLGQAQVITAVTFPKPTAGIGKGTSDTAVTLHYLPSFAETNTYFDGTDFVTNPGFGVLSVVVDTSFFRPPAGPLTPTIHVEYFDKNKFYSEGGGTAIRPPNDGWLNYQRGFDVGFNDETGEGCRLTGQVYNDATFGVSTRTVFTNFEIRAAGKDNFSNLRPSPSTTPPPLRTTHMRDAFAQTYAMKVGLQMEGMHYKPIKTFVNGCYWGIYEFREIPDQDYLNYYFGLNRDSVDILRQHGTGSVITANLDTGWVTGPAPLTYTPGKSGVFNQIAFNYAGGYNNPVYNNIKKRFNIYSFMDFFIYNSFLVNPEPPALNMSWWRRTNMGDLGRDSLMKWRYFMWDMNNILDIEVSPVSVSTVALTNTVSPCIYTSTLYPTASFSTNSYTASTAPAYASHGYLLNKLMSGAPPLYNTGNIEFKHGYITRYMDLLNTSLKCDKLIQHYNYFKTIFTPEIPFHAIFWNLNQPDWDNAMDTLKYRITQRCEKVDSLMQKCMNLAGPYLINIDVKPSGAGTVDFNTLHLSNFIWSGEYYQNKTSPYILSYLEAWPVDTTLYVFDHWEWTSNTNSLTALPQDLNAQNYLFRDSISFIVGSSDNITAVFTDKRDPIVLPTGFTPNADGINDMFNPLGLQAHYARDFEMQVWNRWGEEVFRSNTYTQGWDGTHKGVPAQTGVYAWMLKYKNVENENKVLKGNVTLIR
jgi:gliding motility-associated-like protein